MVVSVVSSLEGSDGNSVQVYEIVGGDYYLVTLDTIYDLSHYKVTAYRDSGYRAGNLIRVLIAVKK